MAAMYDLIQQQLQQHEQQLQQQNQRQNEQQLQQQNQQQQDEDNDDAQSCSNESTNEEMFDPDFAGKEPDRIVSYGVSFPSIADICSQPPSVEDMRSIRDKDCIFMISPFKYDPKPPRREPEPFYSIHNYQDRWDEDHVRMPCSVHNVDKGGRSKWPLICSELTYLKNLCDKKFATTEDLKRTIERCNQRRFNLSCLEKLINQHYTDDKRAHFMSTVLSNICSLAIRVRDICGQALPLLRVGTNKSVTLSQKQAASLLACEFFCLFPYRCDRKNVQRFGQFPKLNFHRLYDDGPPKKIEKLKCILHYFTRITDRMPTGVITIQRRSLSDRKIPKWSESKTELCEMHMTTGKKIEEVHNVLQVDFANKYIGGGVLGGGCVQEEIRFAICPEMLVSLLVCQKMEVNECIFLIGCEQYASYEGYSDSFKFAGDYHESSLKDNWGRKWCHLVAMDAIYFREKSSQYNIDSVKRELTKAYTSFRPLDKKSEYKFGIATGNWGCGAFNGDKYLKAIIQIMAASEANRPLVYAAYRDIEFINSLNTVYDGLKKEKATVGHLYKYIDKYFALKERKTLFAFIFETSVRKLDK